MNLEMIFHLEMFVSRCWTSRDKKFNKKVQKIFDLKKTPRVGLEPGSVGHLGVRKQKNVNISRTALTKTKNNCRKKLNKIFWSEMSEDRDIKGDDFYTPIKPKLIRNRRGRMVRDAALDKRSEVQYLPVAIFFAKKI